MTFREEADWDSEPELDEYRCSACLRGQPGCTCAPEDAMLEAEVRGHIAFRKFREGASHSTREKALQGALTAESDYIAARLAYWVDLLKPKNAIN